MLASLVKDHDVQVQMPGALLVEGDGSLNGGLVTHRLKTFGPLFDLEDLVDNAVDLDLPRVEVINSSGELVGLREGAYNSDFVTDYQLLALKISKKT